MTRDRPRIRHKRQCRGCGRWLDVETDFRHSPDGTSATLCRQCDARAATATPPPDQEPEA